MRLRLASYNIHAGIGSDGHFDPRRLERVLQALDADIIGLQEVVSVGPDGFALLDELAQACDMEAIAGPTMMRGDARYGNALLTRRPVENIRRLELGYDSYEPRGALSVELPLGRGAPLTVAVTHFGLRARERRSQAEKLLEWLPPSPAPLILLGDLNEWWPWSGNLRRFTARFGPSPSLRTYPARVPLLALDRILISPEAWLYSLRREREGDFRLASDHLPLVAELRIQT